MVNLYPLGMLGACVRVAKDSVIILQYVCELSWALSGHVWGGSFFCQGMSGVDLFSARPPHFSGLTS